MKSFLLTIFLLVSLLPLHTVGQVFTVAGNVSDAHNGKPIADASVCISGLNICVTSDGEGHYKLEGVANGSYRIIVGYAENVATVKEITIKGKNITADITVGIHTAVLDSVAIRGNRLAFGATHLKDVDGTGIYAGKKSEVIIMKDITANTATNNTRQIYARIAGLNIWENDGGAGIQLAIGGRGLNPNRVSNFNTRQNGYDISADALGYPESYYTPPADALERIEIVRGAASLQYGTQFGGIINFKLNSGVDSQKMQIVSRESVGSWHFLNFSNSIGGTVKKWNYYAFYQHKQGNGWRDYSKFNVNMAYFATTYKASSKLSITAQYTHMDYLEQQPGGLSDLMFAADPSQVTKERNWFKVNWNLGALLLDYRITDNLTFNTRMFGLLADRAALGVVTTVTDPGGPRQYRLDNYRNWGNESRLLYQYNNNKVNPFTLLFGARYYSGYTHRQLGDSNDGNTGTKADFSYTKASLTDSLDYSPYTFPNHNMALFAENIFRITDKLSIIPGVRYEHIVTNANGFYNNYVKDHAGNVVYSSVVTENRASKRSFVIGGIGLSYFKNAAVQVYANISQNYKSINFNDMSIVNINYRVDSNLQDEKGYSADLGLRGHYVGIFNYDISLFTINYNNRIGSALVKDAYSPNTYQFTTNISQSRNFGVETFVEADIWKLIRGGRAKSKLLVFSNFTWTSARYVNSKVSAYNNNRVEFVPDVVFKTGLTFRNNKFSATYQYSYTSMQFSDATNATTPSNDGINGPVPAYFIMDLTASYTINRFLSVSGSVNNLSNCMYYTRRADTYPGPGIIPADARGYYMTLQVKI